ncbi:phospholipase A2 inhibitor subunit gamma B-like [Rana temporaria]|uniref:phospholipase A2 inhibitor subunit gamma B-like n=1 Tax=Rana temporaria TaxID=8407 RepID=UPI001AAC97E4|nr:phospholipase A2 inhibitor subunit gamma B-like [Rana temporaria]
MSSSTMALIAVLCVLSALTATGYSFSCQLCVASDQTTCSGVNILCPTNYVCGTKLSNMTISGTSTLTVNRLCSPPDQCNKSGSVTIPGGTVLVGMSCCYTSECNPPMPILSSMTDNSTNGITCRSCLTVNSNECYNSNTIRCTGSETKCLLQNTKITGTQPVTVAMRGCATEDICSFGSQSFNSSSFTSTYNYICTSRSIRTYSLVSAPTLVLFLLVKFVL